MPPSLFLALIGAESGWNPNAVSPAGAVGIAQIVPKWHPSVNARDPYASLNYAANLLAGHYRSFGSWKLALAAYNAGAGAVKKYGGVPPYAETQNYVQKILAAAGGIPTGGGGGGGGAPAGPPSMEINNSLASFAMGNLQALAEGNYDPIASLEQLTALVGSGLEAGGEPAGGGGGGQFPDLGKADFGPGKVDTRLLRLAKQYGLSITSGYRTPEQNSATNGSPTSYHMSGLAIDVAPSQGFMRLAKLARRNPGMFREFFYDGLGWYIKNGRIIKGAIGGHGDHGHIVLS